MSELASAPAFTLDAGLGSGAWKKQEPTLDIGEVDITPAMAQWAFDNRRPGRQPKKAAIEKYARDMRAGRWMMNGSSIVFAQGILIDGQNRMLAIMRSGATVRMLVIGDVFPEAVLTIDTGVPRRFSDHLAIDRRMSNTKLLSAVTTRMYRWDVQNVRLVGSHTHGKTVTFSFQDLDAYFTEHEKEITDALVFPVPTENIRLLMPRSLFASILIILRRIDRDQADSFMTRLTSGMPLPDVNADPAIILRNRLLNERQALTWRPVRGVTNQDLIAALTFIAWNIARQGKQVVKIQLPKGGLTAQNFPIPA